MWRRPRKWVMIPFIILVIAAFFAAGLIVEQAVALSRLLTGGQLTGMAIAGWIFYFIPFALLWAVALFIERKAGTNLTAVCLALLILLVPIVAHTFPAGYNETLADAITGPGGGAFVAGARNAVLGGLIPTVLVPFVLFNENLRVRFDDRTLRLMMIAPVVAVLTATLIAAVVLAP